MEPNWELISNFAIAMLAVVNPVEKIPLWVEASKGSRFRFQWLLASLIVFSCACVLLVFLWFGRQLLMELKIDLASFKIGGGLILLQFGFSMMKGTAVDFEHEPEDDALSMKGRVLRRYRQIFIPIGVPVIAGPGAITTAIIYGYQSQTPSTLLLLSIAVLGVLALLLLILLTGPLIQKTVGQLPLDLISRIFGMILIAIAVQFMVDGLTTVFPGWVQGA
jgi:multiple antibiotic resistance protein